MWLVWNILWGQKVSNYSKTDGDMLKGYKNQLERALHGENGTIWAIK